MVLLDRTWGLRSSSVQDLVGLTLVQPVALLRGWLDSDMSPVEVRCGLTQERGGEVATRIRSVGRGSRFDPNEEERMSTTIIGIDPHKRSHTAVVLDECEQIAAQLRVEASPWQVDQLRPDLDTERLRYRRVVARSDHRHSATIEHSIGAA